MNRQQIEDRLHFLFLQLRVITIDRKSFIKNEEESGTQARIDAILDEVYSLREKLEKLDAKKIKIMATKSATDTKKILTDIDKTLQELHTGIVPENLSASDRKSLLADLDKLENAALEAKEAIANG